MAFGGAPVIKQVTKTLWRLTGVTLAGAASGEIGFSDKTVPAEVEIVAPDWQPKQVDGAIVSLQDAVKVTVEAADDDVVTAIPISVIKSGTTHLDFAITLHNDTAATLSPDLEIYIELAGH